MSDAGPERRVRLADPRLWAFVAAYALGALPLGLVLYGAPLYLHGVLGQDQASLGRLLWLPPVGWEVGYFFWGALTDFLTRRRSASAGSASASSASAGSASAGSTAAGAGPMPALMVGLTLLSLPLVATTALPGLAPVLGAFVLATFAASGFVIVALAYAARTFSSRDVGLIAGIGAGSWSAVLAGLMPVFGWLFDAHAHASAFALATAAPVVALLVWSAVERRTREPHRPAIPAPQWAGAEEEQGRR